MPDSTRIRSILGWAAVVAFLVMYAAEFFPRHGPPVTIRWLHDHLGKAGLIAVNIVVVLGFLILLPYRRSTKAAWQSRGAFIAFVIALMTEMFGWPLLLFVVSPLVEVPSLAGKMHGLFGHTHATVGTVLSMAGVLLIALGWNKIHRADGLVTTGVYRRIRHPQYTGIFLFTSGWILHWPSVITLVIWPILMAAYVWLALREERDALAEFGEKYREYMERTKRFVPWVV